MLLGIDEFFRMCELKGSFPNRIFGFIVTIFIALAYSGIYSHHQITDYNWINVQHPNSEQSSNAKYRSRIIENMILSSKKDTITTVN